VDLTSGDIGFDSRRREFVTKVGYLLLTGLTMRPRKLNRSASSMQGSRQRPGNDDLPFDTVRSMNFECHYILG
jgi:hypothetical protein